LPTGEAPIPETATQTSDAGKSGAAKPEHASVVRKEAGFRPLAALKSTIRSAPWIVIAVVLHVIIFAVLGIVYVQSHKANEEQDPASISVGQSKPEENPEPEIKAEEIIDRNAIPKAQNVDATLEAGDELMADMPIVAGDAGDSNAPADVAGGPDASSANASGGTALGVGSGPGHFGTGKPSAFVSRVAGTGTGVPRGTDATAKTQKAVRDGLLWLARHQKADGSWSAANLHEVCDKDAACDANQKGAEFTTEYDEGLTGLALLAFLGFGADHTNKLKVVDNRGKTIRLGEVVKNGLLYLKKRQEQFKDGRFSENGHIYNEALATLAMCEAYGMTHNEKFWKEPAQNGVNFLIAAQRMSPGGTGLWGWRYEPRAWIEGPEGKAAFPDEKEWKARTYWSDISATAWVVMALKSAELAELTVNHDSMKGAMEFTKWVTVKDGRVAYMDPMQVGRKIAGPDDHFGFHPATLDALGMCVRTFVEKNIEDPVLEMSAKHLLDDVPTLPSRDKKGEESKDPKEKLLGIDYYYWYYGTLALNQFDGPDSPKRTNKYWRPWNKALTEVLLPLQTPAESKPKACGEGGWATPDRWSYAGGPIYRTAINVLTLEVYYRYENAFGAGSKKTPK
jgi:hypothetical protein